MNDPTKRPRTPRARSLRSTDPAAVLAALSDPDVVRRAGLHDLVSVLTTARTRMLRPDIEAADGRLPNALVTLAVVRVLLDQLAGYRFAFARDALIVGATVAQVAELLDLDVAEVVAGLRSWASSTLDEAGEVEVDELLAAGGAS